MAHVIVTEGLADEAFIRERCDRDEYEDWARFVSDERHSPESSRPVTRVPAEELRAAARLYATGGNGAIYYGLGVTEHSQGSSTVMAIANLAMATGNIGRPGVGVNPLRGPEQRAGRLRHGQLPARAARLSPHPDADDARPVREATGASRSTPSRACGSPTCSMPRSMARFKAIYIQGEDILQSDPDTQHVAAGLAAMDCVIVHDLFLNETANYAHVFLPGSTFLEKDGTFTNAERRIQLVRKVMEPANGYGDWEVTQLLANAIGRGLELQPPERDHGRDRPPDASFAGVRYALLDAAGSLQWPVNEAHPDGTPVMHVDGFVRGKGKFVGHRIRADRREDRPALPAAADHRPHPDANTTSARRRGARRNVVWHAEDVLEIHPPTPRTAGSRTATGSRLASRKGETTLAARSPTGWRRGWSTPPSTTRRPRPTWSPPTSPTGRPIAPNTR